MTREFSLGSRGSLRGQMETFLSRSNQFGIQHFKPDMRCIVMKFAWGYVRSSVCQANLNIITIDVCRFHWAHKDLTFIHSSVNHSRCCYILFSPRSQTLGLSQVWRVFFPAKYKRHWKDLWMYLHRTWSEISALTAFPTPLLASHS